MPQESLQALSRCSRTAEKPRNPQDFCIMATYLRGLAQNPPQDANERRELYEAARLLTLTLETPFDAMHRLFWSVSVVVPRCDTT